MLRFCKGWCVSGAFKFSKKFCPCCILLFCTEHDEYRTLKTVAGFAFGTVLGVGEFASFDLKTIRSEWNVLCSPVPGDTDRPGVRESDHPRDRRCDHGSALVRKRPLHPGKRAGRPAGDGRRMTAPGRFRCGASPC